MLFLITMWWPQGRPLNDSGVLDLLDLDEPIDSYARKRLNTG